MSSIIHLTGDATKPVGGGPKIIAHVCNNRGGWGKGFVLALNEAFGDAPKDTYKRACHDLGTISVVSVADDLFVCNMVAQDGYWDPDTNPVPLSYPALSQCLVELALTAGTLGASIHMPKIGTGLAGGDWNIVENIIDVFLTDGSNPADVFVYTLPTERKTV